jgi:PAS domain S-box-containing protein
MSGTYQPILVTLSIVIAMLASYAALDLASRVTAAQGRRRAAWLLGGSVAMGIGIWSMHFVAMLALTLPVPTMYDVPLVVLSVLVAIGASLVALVVVSREAPSMAGLALAAPLMGSAIAGMHYIGMAAVRVPAVHRYDSRLVVLSVAIAIGASYAALWLAFRFRSDHAHGAWLRKAASAAVMGLAIAGMHYTAMAAATFAAPPAAGHALGHVLATPALAASVVVTAFVILGMAVFSAMIDRWSRMHAAVRESEERFRLLVENVDDYAIYTLDRDGNVASWNQGAERLEQYQRAEIVGRHFSCFFPPEEAGTAEIAIRTAAAAGRFEEEGWRVRKDGSRYWASSAINALRDAEGRLVGFVRITRDMTARRQTEEALKHSEASLRSFVDHAPFGIYRSTPQGRFLAVNAALVEMLGYESEADLLAVDIGRDVYLAADERLRVSEHYRKLDRLDVHLRWKRKDGTPITVRITGRPVRDADGELRHWEAFVEDVTPLMAAEQALRESEARLRQAQKMEAVGTLAGGVAHDFNNLLTAIKCNGEFLLAELGPSDPHREEVVEIAKAADRAAALTRQLLAFSRRQMLQPRVLDLNAVIGDMEKLLRRLIIEDIHLVTLLDSSLGRICADPSQLEQVIMNLAVNARDAMPTGGTLTIETSNVELDGTYTERRPVVEPGRYVMLAVTDTGCGIEPETQARVFEPFFTTKERGKGTGLGLSTVYGIVKQSGGYVWVYSEPRQGTTFKVYLPRFQDSAQPDDPGPRHVERLDGTETILLVEDEETVRALARKVLERKGYTVLDARHGKDALLISQRHRGAIQLLLTDMVMPEMGGRELAEHLAGMDERMRVLYMSGYTDDAVARRGLAAPGAAFLQKPFTADALARAVRRVLDGV